LWVIAGLALVLALAALAAVRRISRKLDTVKQSYWELRYDYTRLRAEVARLEAAAGLGQDPEGSDAAAAPQPPATPSISFVPLSAMRKKDK
jgi:hypothetical protein